MVDPVINRMVEAERRDGGPGQAAEQLALIPEVVEDRQVAAAERAARGPGRPKGSSNLSAREWANYIISKYNSPLMGLAETATASIEDLTRELCCTRFEAAQFRQAAQDKLAPYLHSKMPIAVQTEGSGLVNLVINTGLIGVENQGVSQLIDEKFNKTCLTEDSEVIENEDKRENLSPDAVSGDGTANGDGAGQADAGAAAAGDADVREMTDGEDRA